MMLVSADANARLSDALQTEERGNETAALSAFDALIREHQTWELPRLEAARLRLKTGQRVDLAERDADIARSLAPENPRAHYLFALAADDQGHRSEARHALETALSLRPDYSEAQNRLAGLLSAEGQYAAAARVYKLYLAGHPADVGSNVQWALALERSGSVAQAEAALRALASRVPSSRLVALRTLAAMLERQGRPKEAQQIRTSPEPPARKMRELNRSSH